MPAASRPAVTAEHQRAAFEAFAWTGWTFEQAMADPLRSRLVKLRARQICSAAAALRRVRFVAFQKPPQPYRPVHLSDLKRAAAGDRDDD
jgi:hypothetical protein